MVADPIIPLYLQHCVDSNNEINEGINETPNCSISGPYVVSAANCPTQTIINCSLTQTPPSTNANGTCTTGYVGACRYTCDATGNWNPTSITNTCTLLTGNLTVTPDADPSDADVDVPTGNTLEVSWNTNATTNCTIDGLPGSESPWTNQPVDGGPRTTRGVVANSLITLVCDGVLLDAAQVTKPADLDEMVKIVQAIDHFWTTVAKLPRRC